MDALWTLSELVAEVAARIAALPAPRNGQVRAVPDERTVRYYVTLGLLDRPSAMRGRTALYGPRHVAQVVAIKRLQTMGRSLSEIQAVWPTLDDPTLARMSGVALVAAARPAARAEFWKREPQLGGAAANGDARSRPHGPGAGAAGRADPSGSTEARGSGPISGRSSGAPASAPAGLDVAPPPGTTAVELRIELAPQIVLSLSVVDGVTVSPADVRAIRAAAAPLLAELASRRLASHPGGDE